MIVGVAAVWIATKYPIGSLGRMGPGYFPIVLGAVLGFLGLVVMAQGGPAERSQDFAMPWRAFICIGGGISLFAVVIDKLGLLAATAALVFVVSFSDPRTSIRSAATLAVAVSIFAFVVFSWLLDLPIRTFWWG